MSQHPNADGSITGGVKVEARGKFVSHQLGLVATAVVSPTVPAGRNEAVRGDRACPPVRNVFAG